MTYKLIVTSVVYKETAIFYGSLAEMTSKIEEFDSVGEYTFSIQAVR